MKYLGLLLIILVSITFITAESMNQRQDAQTGEEYIISQPCATCSYINISVFTKDGIILSNVPMINNGTAWIYQTVLNDSLRHDVNGIGDINGLNDSFAFWFDVTLSGQQTSPVIIIADIFLIFLIGLLMFVLHSKYNSVNFEKESNKITESHDGNIGKTFIKRLGYGFMKNSFLWYYSLGWFLLIIVKDLVFRFNSTEIYGYLNLFVEIYSFGFLLVIVAWIGIFYKMVVDQLDILDDLDMGVDE